MLQRLALAGPPPRRPVYSATDAGRRGTGLGGVSPSFAGADAPSPEARDWSATAASPDAPPRRPFARCDRRGGATGWRPLGAIQKWEILGRSSLAGPVEFEGKRVPILNIVDVARRRHWAESARRSRH
jgi:hypothetical protein